MPHSRPSYLALAPSLCARRCRRDSTTGLIDWVVELVQCTLSGGDGKVSQSDGPFATGCFSSYVLKPARGITELEAARRSDAAAKEAYKAAQQSEKAAKEAAERADAAADDAAKATLLTEKAAKEAISVRFTTPMHRAPHAWLPYLPPTPSTALPSVLLVEQRPPPHFSAAASASQFSNLPPPPSLFSSHRCKDSAWCVRSSPRRWTRSIPSRTLQRCTHA